MNTCKIGDKVVLDANMFLANKSNPTRSHMGFKKGDIVRTKYGPQLICEVEGLRLTGIHVKIIGIDESKEGYYREWPIYTETLARTDLSDKGKMELLLELLNQ